MARDIKPRVPRRRTGQQRLCAHLRSLSPAPPLEAGGSKPPVISWELASGACQEQQHVGIRSQLGATGTAASPVLPARA